MGARLTEEIVDDPVRLKSQLNIILRELGSPLRITDTTVRDKEKLAEHLNRAIADKRIRLTKEIVSDKQKFVEQINSAITKQGV